MPCRECRAPISPSAKACPSCGAPKPARGPVVHGLHRLGNFCIWLGLIVIVLMILVAATWADDHKRVAWDELESGKAYMIRTEIHSQTFYQTKLHGVWVFPGGGFFKVYERIVHEGVLWYRTKWIKPQSLDPNENIEGWIRADELRGHGAYVVRGYD